MEVTGTVKPRITGVLPQIAWIIAAGIALRLLLSPLMQRRAAGGMSPAVWLLALGVAAAVFVLIGQFLRLLRSRDNWALYMGTALLFILFYRFGKYRPELAPIELPLAILCLAPAGILVWALIRQIRRADELERRILYEALAVAFVVQFVAAIVYALLEATGVERLPSILWACLLVMSWSVGLAVSSRRYS
jgi:hypothetical protein